MLLRNVQGVSVQAFSCGMGAQQPKSFRLSQPENRDSVRLSAARLTT